VLNSCFAVAINRVFFDAACPDPASISIYRANQLDARSAVASASLPRLESILCVATWGSRRRLSPVQQI